jgi:hypothetical protein
MTLVLLDDERTTVVTRVPEGEARREATLRDLIAEHPNLLPTRDLDPSFGALMTVTRELSIPGVGFVDVLLVDANGRLVVVECKLWRNPQARREVVGQILDYARALSRFGYEDLQRQVSIATKRQGNVLYALAQAAGTSLSEAEFVDRVSRDLAAGRFLLLVVGDGIAEGTRRIGEYLRDQPGLAFSFGLIEMAEYRHTDASGAERVIMQPRVLAQTALINRHVIRSEVPGVLVETTAPEPAPARTSAAQPLSTSDAAGAWRGFAERLVAELRFDDPGQPQARSGGTGWIRVPLSDGLYVNVYRAVSSGVLGAQVRFASDEARAHYAALLDEREAIAVEFASAGLDAPEWQDGDVPLLGLTTPLPPSGDDAEVAQRAWMARAANQFVNSLRPRLQRSGAELAA